MQTHERKIQKSAEVRRLLGPEGIALLDRVLAVIRRAAKKRNLPLVRIEVRHRRDDEVPDWEYVLVFLVYAAPFDEAAAYHRSLYPAIDAFENALSPAERQAFQRRVYFDFFIAA